MEIQQHDGVVVEAAGISAGLRQAQREGEVVRGEREAPRTRVRLPSLPPLYIGVLGVRRPPRDPISRGGLGFPTLDAGGGPRGAHQPTRGWFPSLFSPRGPPG